MKPWGFLTLSGKTLYGMTYVGGANPGNYGNGLGTIFSIPDVPPSTVSEP